MGGCWGQAVCLLVRMNHLGADASHTTKLAHGGFECHGAGLSIINSHWSVTTQRHGTGEITNHGLGSGFITYH